MRGGGEFERVGDTYTQREVRLFNQAGGWLFSKSHSNQNIERHDRPMTMSRKEKKGKRKKKKKKKREKRVNMNSESVSESGMGQKYTK